MPHLRHLLAWDRGQNLFLSCREMTCLGGASQTGTGNCQNKQMTKQREEKKVKFISAANSRNLEGSGLQPRLVLNRRETVKGIRKTGVAVCFLAIRCR